MVRFTNNCEHGLMREGGERFRVGPIRGKRQFGGLRQTERFLLPLTNTDDVEVRFHIEGSEPEEACCVIFQAPDVHGHRAQQIELSIPPGGTSLVSVTIRPRSLHLLSLKHKVHFCLIAITRLGESQSRRAILVRSRQKPLLGINIFIPLVLILLCWSVGLPLSFFLEGDVEFSFDPAIVDLPVQYQLTQEKGNASAKIKELFWVEPTTQEIGSLLAEPSLPPICSKPDLIIGQYISTSGSYTETQTTAAGPIGCRIERSSCEYHDLVGDLDPSIVFKREEEPPYDEEDILMHPAALLPLSRLKELVQQEWGGEVRLRVTDAYDSLLEHDLGQPDETKKASLHFEGRALDLTTWPIDPARYGRLCILAHCAGFDWVHNEGTHCHAAIKAESLCAKCK